MVAALISNQYIYAAPKFSQPILAKAYEQISIRIDAKASKVSLDESSKQTIEQKKAHLGDILVAIDQAFQKKDKKTFQAQILLFRAGYKEAIDSIPTPGSSNVVRSNPVSTTPETDTVKNTDITYYADSFEWGGTANGDTFSQAYFSAAACVIPYNTLAQLQKGDKSVIVKINDRPNCTRYPNITDLSTTAFKVLGKISSGRLSGTINLLGVVPKNYTKQVIATDAFRDLWIELDPGLPNTYLKNETIHIIGKNLLDRDHTIFYLKSPSGKNITLGMERGTDNTFEYDYPLEEVGTYTLVLASGSSFDGPTWLSIYVLDDAVFSAKVLSPETGDSGLLESIETERIELSPSESVYLMHFPTADFHTVTIKNDSDSVVYRGFDTVAIRANTLASFDAKTPVTIEVTSQKSSTSFSHDTYTTPVTVFKKTMTLAAWYTELKSENITTSIDGGNLMIHGIITKGKNVNSEIIVTLPNGDVKKYPFDAENVDADTYLKRERVFEQSIPLTLTGLYHVEINYDIGFAAYNGTVTYGDILPMYPNESDTIDKNIKDTDTATVGTESTAFINTIRARAGKSAVVLDDTLSTLALIKAKDMATHNNLSHTDSHGDLINVTAKKNNIKVVWSLGENISWGNESFRILMIGLSNSGWHRGNMLGNWGKVGIGYTVKDGMVYYVQVFEE